MEKNQKLDDETISKINKQIISENNIMRKEKLLILPYNTLRVFDTCVQADLERAKNPNWHGDFETVLRQVLTRSIKDLGVVNGIDSDLVKKLMIDSWCHYYEIAPRTNAYEMIETLSEQSFMTDIITLFPKRGVEEEWTNAYYDGSIDELEKFINENNITSIMMDDVELLMSLINRKNVDLNWKSIFISKIGYNYERNDDGILIMKHSLEWSNEYALEVASLSLINF